MHLVIFLFFNLPGTSGGSNNPTSDSTSVQRADSSLNNCEGAAGSTSEKSR